MDDPADLIFMEPELLFVHPSEESYKIAQCRAINAVRIFRGTHPDAVYLSKEIQGLCIPHERRIADIIKVNSCFTARRMVIAWLTAIILRDCSACR